MSNNYTRISDSNQLIKELKDKKQWVVWGDGKKPFSPVTGLGTASNEPRRNEWGTYEQACERVRASIEFGIGGYKGIGFVLTDDCPYTFIDLDYAGDDIEGDDEGNGQRAWVREMQARVLSQFDSYKEVSPSGRGYHIVIRGKLPPGHKRKSKSREAGYSKIEIYCRSQYMTVTGQVIGDGSGGVGDGIEIKDCQEQLNALYSEMFGSIDGVAGSEADNRNLGGLNAGKGYVNNDISHTSLSFVVNGGAGSNVGNGVGTNVGSNVGNGRTNESILFSALTYEHSERFKKLWAGDYAGAGYDDKSAGDQAAANILVKFGAGFEQAMQMMLLSELGWRESENGVRWNKIRSRPDYLKSTVKRAFDDKSPVDISKFVESVRVDGFVESVRVDEVGEVDEFARVDEFVRVDDEEIIEKFDFETSSKTSEILVFPDGHVGELAQYIYDQSPHPMEETALLGAMSLMAGMFGRAYNVRNAGLNLQSVVLAGTGFGKDAMREGMGKIIQSAVDGGVICATDFIGPARLASGDGLVNYMCGNGRFDRKPSLVCIFSEFGKRLDKWIGPNATSSDRDTAFVFLESYGSSGKGGSFGVKVHSDKTKNIQGLKSPSITLLGESVSKPFYKYVNEETICDGTISRMIILDRGDNFPDYNKNNEYAVLNKDVAERFKAMAVLALEMNNEDKVINMQFSKSASELSSDYRNYCIKLRKGEDEIIRGIYSRTALSADKWASIIALGMMVPHTPPVIERWMMELAICIVTTSAENILARFKGGDTGNGVNDVLQEAKVMEKIKKYFNETNINVKKIVKTFEPKMKSDRVIPYSWIQSKLASDAAFVNDYRKATNAINGTINLLIDKGILELIPKHEMKQKYKYRTSQKCFLVNSII